MIDLNIIKLDTSNIECKTIGGSITGLCVNKNNEWVYVTDSSNVYVIYDIEHHPDILVKIHQFGEDDTISGVSCDENNNLYVTSVTTTKNQDEAYSKTVLYTLKQVNGIYQLSGDPKSFSVNKVAPDNETNAEDVEQTGFNGVSYFKANQLYLGFNKWYNGSYPAILRGSLTTNKITKRSTARFAGEITSLCYVSEQDNIWVLDGEKAMIHICNANASLINSIEIPNDPPNYLQNNKNVLKAIYVDFKNKKIYLGCNFGIGAYNLFIIDFEVKKIKIASAYFFKYAINKIMYGLNVIWTRITGCFSSGTWVKSSDWIKDEIWKNE